MNDESGRRTRRRPPESDAVFRLSRAGPSRRPRAHRSREGFATRYPGPLQRDATGRQIDGVTTVRAHPRRERDGGTHMVREHERRVPSANAGEVERAWVGQGNEEWRGRIAYHESRESPRDHGYGVRARPPSTAMGRYQINRATLIEAGWKDANGNWTPLAAQFGIRSAADFLSGPNAPRAQEAALNAVLASYERQITSDRNWDLAGTEIVGVSGRRFQMTESGLVAAAHRQGTGALRQYLDHVRRGAPMPADPDTLRRFRAVEFRLREFAAIPYTRLTR